MEKKFRVLVVGCGTISAEWLPVLSKRDDCTICAVVDIRPEAAEKRLREFGISCAVYDAFDTALEAEKPDIVVDLSFPMCHHDITVKALRAGCHVFGEKPMAMTREDAQDMMQTAQECGLTYDVLQNRRYLPGIRALQRAVSEGMLGKIWMTCCEIYVNADLSSVRNTLPYPMLQDQAIHSFDSARFILGADAKTVYAHSYNPEGSPYNGDGSGACIFEMSDGSTLVYNAVMGTDYMKTAWHSAWRIIGQKGTAVWNGFDPVAHAEIKQPDGSICKTDIEPSPDWNGIQWHEGAIHEMFEDLKAGRPSSLACFGNYGSVAMEFSALDSIRTGGKVSVY